MDKRKHLEVSSQGGKNKREDTSRKGTIQTQESSSEPVLRMEDVLRNLEETQDELSK